MEMELEPSVKPLSYKIKGMSRESPSQKAVNVLDTDLRNHWSTGTNTKEWILLELDEPCLLSHIRIYNKSVLEWEIAVGLRYKPDAFVKVRPRCEAPRRDMMYPMNYTPCRYVRISCLRGNPIALFFIQLIGVSIPGLEPEFQPVVNHLLPHIIAHKQNAHNMHLQLLQDMTDRLLVFLPHLEADLTSCSEDAESSTRFLAMLAGPFYPILHLVNERETARASNGLSDTDPLRSTQATTLSVSSNFEAQPRRARSPSPYVQPASSSIVFRPDAVLVLLRRAYKESHLGTICRAASRALHKLVEPAPSPESLALVNDQSSSVTDETVKAEAPKYLPLVDYSSLFGEEFRIPDNNCDSRYLNVLDLGVTEEGILHVLFACASQPLLCRKLADSVSDLWSVLPLVQALVPALRPPVSSLPEHVDDSFSQWKQPFVQQALSQITATLSSSVYRPLLHACAGYLSSYSPSHAKAACLLIDLCSGPLAPWISTVIAKVDLAIELLEELLGTIQGVQHSITRARAAIKYVILALSGHMDDVLTKYKEVKYNVLFLLEMLGPFLDPALSAMKNTIAFGDVSAIFLEKQEHNCAIALNIIRMAVRKPAVLPSLEYEWRHGSVAPSVLLSILDPNMALPPEIDLCKCLITVEQDVSSTFSNSSALHHGGATREESDGKTENFEVAPKFDALEDASFLFAPIELKNMALRNHSSIPDGQIADKIIAEASQIDAGKEGKYPVEETLNNLVHNGIVLDVGFAVEYFKFQADFLQLMNHRDCELRASEFQRLALELHSQPDITPEGHDAVIDALLLAAECYVNPFFMINFRANPMVISQMCNIGTRIPIKYEIAELRKVCDKKNSDLEIISHLERKRDITVLQILLEAAEMDRKYQRKMSKGNQSSFETEGNEQEIKISSFDKDNVDAVTLVRQNQSLLCHFLIQHLQREQHSMHEILMQSLLFFLQSATELFCPPEHVIDIILGYAEHLNRLLTSFYYQLKENNMQLDPEKAYGVQRQWVILQNLVIASSTGEEGPNFTINTRKGYQYKNLIPFSSWMQKVPKFSSSPYPLVRVLGWMAVSRYAEQYLKERLFLASDISQLNCLLSVFADELAVVDHIVKDGTVKLAHSGNTKDFQEKKVFELTDQSGADGSFHVIYPDLHKFFPNMKKQFVAFGEIILEATALQLRSFPSSVIPDILCWFSDLCLWPFVERVKDGNCTEHTSDHLKGYSAKNAKAIILYTLEAIVIEHMEAMVPEIPRVVQVLVCLCKASYCDVVFLDSVLCLLKPLISYALKKMSDDEKMLMDDSSCLNFESLCFDELFNSVKYRNDNQDGTKRLTGGALTIYVLGALFPDLSFQRKREILQSAKLWANFTTFEPAPAFFDYLCGFQKVIESCKLVIIQTLHIYGIPYPVKTPGVVTVNSVPVAGGSEIDSCFHDAISNSSFPSLLCGQFEDDVNADLLSKKSGGLSPEEIDDFSKSLSELINELSPTIDHCWKLHHQLAMKLTLTSAWCYMYSKCLSSVAQKVSVSAEDASENISEALKNYNSVHWRSGLEGLAGAVMTLQQNRCWQVASTMLDYLLCVPKCFSLDAVLGTLCSVMAQFCCHAPRILWRLQTDKWLSILFMRGIGSVKEDDVPLVDLFHVMLGHPEPEQRSVALKNLGRLVGKDTNGEKIKLPFSFNEDFVAVDLACSVSESVRSFLVLRTWDRVVLLASSDPSIFLRIHAMTLLLNFVPFAERTQLQSFLSESDSILHSLGKLAYSVCESPLTQISLALLAGVCLYSPAEDISLIPQSLWRNLETLGMSTSGGKIGDLEKKACQALCSLRTSEDDAKVVLKEFFSSGSASKQSDPEFGSTRESILQVLANLSSVQAYFDIFSKRIDREATELEEAEIEMDLLQKEHVPQDSSENHREETQQLPFVSAEMNKRNRLQQIKDSIRATEKARLREDIVARRQKKLLFRCTRQKYLEEAALREAELLQELDRERTSEMERDIERQRLLELERAKTRELRYNLDIEKERQTQRELQRELEQAESGIRPSRREFSSSTPSRPRDRYRERENGRSAQEGSLRPSSSGREAGVMPPTTTSSTVPTIVLSGSRQFAGQFPTILQSRDRQDERSTIYEDSYEGSKDSGDTGSVGESELASVFDGQTSGFGSSQRHSSRGSKSRQIMERRERDGRREGKWERKH